MMMTLLIADIITPLLDQLLSLAGYPWLLAGALALATYASEDLACIAGGLVAAAGHLSFPAAAGACAVGIWTGDMLVYLLGWLSARGALKWKWLARKMTPERISRYAGFFDKYGVRWIFLSRFIPGSRVVSYLAAGATGWDVRKFSITLAIAAVIWTPLLCGAAMLAGNVVLEYLQQYERYAIWVLLGVGSCVWLLLKLILPMFTWRGRRLLYGKWLRFTHWEFWPMWLVYIPVGMYIIYLSIRHRCLTLFTASSPAIPISGFAMDSKGDILDLFKADEMLPAYLRLPYNGAERVPRLLDFMQCHRLDWPLVLKPDVGERGQGVAVVKSLQQAEDYLTDCKEEVIAQEYVGGLEYGVYYVRMPDEKTGRIFSLSCKHPQKVVGDGVRNLENLILSDARAVAMARYYMKKFASRLDEIPAAGESIVLVEIGTHARGAVFTDDRELVTEGLREKIDALSQKAGAIHCGRYDVKVPSVADLQAGENIKMLEFNGVTGEPAHVYQPGFPLRKGIADLCRQWGFAYRAGAQNRRLGHQVASLRELLEIIKLHRAKEWYEVDDKS